MRIIAGEARGRSIFAPKGQDTRPTQDYVRESLFNILQREISGASVLDLFAGSGALALEALSRGAADATFVDCSADAIACIQRNTETLRFADRARIIHGDWKLALQRLAGERRTFSLVFLDPPYRMTDTDQQCVRMSSLKLLAQDALVVIEHRRENQPRLGEDFLQRDMRQYGDTEIHFFTYLGGGIADA